MPELSEDAVVTTREKEIHATRVFDAPPELVWEAWTDPKHVAKWWGPKGFTTTIETMDVRPGGVFKLVMHGSDGTEYPNKTVYSEVEKPRRLAYRNAGGKQGGPGVSFHVTTTFEAEGGGTRVTMRMVFDSNAERDKVINEYGAIEGARSTLQRLAELLPALVK